MSSGDLAGNIITTLVHVIPEYDSTMCEDLFTNHHMSLYNKNMMTQAVTLRRGEKRNFKEKR